MKKTILFLLAPFCCTAAISTPLDLGNLLGNKDVEKEIKGDYGPLNRQETLSLGSIQKAWNRAPNESGVYNVVFRATEVIKVRVREFMTTTIVLPKWERISQKIVGDPSSYEVKVLKDNIISIRAKDNIGIDSTVTCLGDSGRVYSFYVRTEGYNSKNVSDVAVYVKVPYSGADPSMPLKAVKDPHDYLQDTYFDPSKINFDFSMSGDESIAPERVYTDGIRTWFDFGDRIHKQNLPTIYSLEDGVDMPINTSRDGTKVVAQASGAFTLKHGLKTVCVLPTKTGK